MELDTSVLALTDLSPSFTRLVLRSDDPDGYSPVLPADGVKLFLPSSGSRPLIRAYTVRGVEDDRITIDVLRHGDSVSQRWVDALQPGDRIRIAAVRREFALGDGVGRLLLVADASALPAVATILLSLPQDISVTAVLHVPSEGDERILPLREEDEMHRITGDAPRGDDTRLLDLVPPVIAGNGRVQAWVAAEAAVTALTRRALLERGLVTRDDLHAVAYWKDGRTSDERDASLLRAFREATDRNDDVNDPLVRSAMEDAADSDASASDESVHA